MQHKYLDWGLPDDTMTDVRIVHDAIGSYADWHVVNGVLPYGNRKELYLLGEMKPNYPVPATCEYHMSPELIDHWFLAGIIPSQEEYED